MAATETRYTISASNKTKEAFKRVQSDMKKTQTATQKLRKATAALATAYVLLRGVGKVVDIWRKFGATISDLSAITGATGKDLEFLTKKSLEFGEATTLSASQAAEAFKLVASAKPDLLENRDALAAVTKEAITLAEASGSTLPDAAKTLAVALNQYGAGADEASRFINILAAGSKRGASEIADTAEAIKVAGLVAAGTNTSFEEMNAAIQVMSTVALKGSEAGTGLRNVYLNLANQSNDKFKPAMVGLTQAMINIREAGLSDVEMLEIFGKKNIVAAKALVNNSAALVKMRENLTGTTTAYEQAAIKVDNLDGDIKKLGSRWEAVAIMLGQTFNPALRLGTQFLTTMGKVAKNVIMTFQDVGNAFGSLAAQAVALSKWDLAGIKAIKEERLKYVANLQKEHAIMWNINGAQDALNKKTAEQGTKTPDLAAIKARATAEQEARNTARIAALQAGWAAEDLLASDKAAADLFKVQEGLLTQSEALALGFENKAFMVEEAFQNGLISDMERKATELELENQHEAKKTKIIADAANARRMIAQRSLGAIASIFDGLGALMSKNGKKQTSATRELARASIIASTAQAVMNALAVPPYPLGIALAVGAGLKGAAQLKAVGGGGGGGVTVPSSSTPTNTSPISPPPNADAFGPQAAVGGNAELTITVEGDGPHSNSMRELAEQLAETIEDMGGISSLRVN